MREAGLIDRLLLLFKRRQPVRVSGDSMLPTLSDGDVVLVARRSSITVGDIVVADHPFKSSVIILKRVASIEVGRIELRGDNPGESSDSRSFGKIPKEAIRGKVVCRLKQR